MDFWILFWGAILAIVLILYTGLFLWVTAGGLADIRAMLASLERGDDAKITEAHKREAPRR